MPVVVQVDVEALESLQREHECAARELRTATDDLHARLSPMTIRAYDEALARMEAVTERLAIAERCGAHRSIVVPVVV